jgi:hypothetical protein
LLMLRTAGVLLNLLGKRLSAQNVGNDGH